MFLAHRSFLTLNSSNKFIRLYWILRKTYPLMLFGSVLGLFLKVLLLMIDRLKCRKGDSHSFQLFSIGNSYHCKMSSSLLKIISLYLLAHCLINTQQNFSNFPSQSRTRNDKLTLKNFLSYLSPQHKSYHQCQVFSIFHKILSQCLPTSFCSGSMIQSFYLNYLSL